MASVSVVIPTCRPLLISGLLVAWEKVFKAHNIDPVIVFDGDPPFVQHRGREYSLVEVMGDYKEVIMNHSGGVRNLGWAYVAKYLRTDIIISLDDDETPIGDPIQDHLDALNMRVPISWMSTASDYMRGFPYDIRDEAEVVISHGAWEGIPDIDAKTQLAGTVKNPTFYKGPIPKGVYYPMSAMNLAFKVKMLPYVYQAYQRMDITGFDRFDDIFAGVVSKRVVDENNWAVVTGYSRVHHNRASNVMENLKKEAKGLELNEKFWQGDESDPYFTKYHEKLNLWQQYLMSL